MTRILLLLVFLLWMAWTPSAGAAPPADSAGETLLFLGVFGLLVLGMGAWGRMLARRLSGPNLHRGMARFNRSMLLARMLIPAWFAVGVFALGWGWTVREAMGPAMRWPVELPALVLGTLPAFLAWVGLWWSQYPADRALREQSLLIHLDSNIPIHAPPTLRQYMLANLRLQLLFTVVPVLMILLARDVVAVVVRQFEATRGLAGQLEAAGMLIAATGVFLVAPEILRRILDTHPLPASPLRFRLEELCRRTGLRYRDILLWRTENNMGNAAVMGVIPHVRYILLSDLLLDTMTDEQIEAVFAHEVGHVVHRHMSWYAIFIVILMLVLAGPGTLIGNWMQDGLPRWLPIELVLTLLGAGGFLLAFGYLSRRFERQADVFAARSMQAEDSPVAGCDTGHVGERGAGIFCAALQRVAAINDIPVEARSWCHGSIASRMNYLRSLSRDPAATTQFDRAMRRHYLALLLILLIFGLWVAVELFWQL